MKVKNVPPSKEQITNWLIEHYGNDFEPKFLQQIVKEYLLSTSTHNQYAKKKSIAYISKNILKLDRIYRKQEQLYWIKRGWTKEIADTKRIVRNKDWYIKTYGEIDGVVKYNTKCSNISANCGHTLEKYINRYGNELGIIKWNDYKENCARNLDYFILKYGNVEGKIKYKSFKKHIAKASKESLLVFKPLIDWLINFIDIHDIYYGDGNSREYFLVEKSKTYLYDFTIKNLNIIIEYNGIKFHVNEEWPMERKINWKHPFKSTNYLECIKNDKMKIELAKKNGFNILTIWSDTPIEENINLCKQFIEKKLNENR